MQGKSTHKIQAIKRGAGSFWYKTALILKSLCCDIQFEFILLLLHHQFCALLRHKAWVHPQITKLFFPAWRVQVIRRSFFVMIQQ